jgi:hypothetical protein
VYPTSCILVHSYLPKLGSTPCLYFGPPAHQIAYHRHQPFKVYWFRDAPTSWIFNNCTLCPHCVYVFCVCLRTNSDLCHLQHKLFGFITEMKSVYSAVRTGYLNKAVCACAPYSINWLVFITDMKRVYSAVRTGDLNKAVCACATYNINWLVFITEIKSVYSAVRTESLNKAVCACATYSINWLVFITDMNSVYSAVRTGPLNKAVCA